MIGSITAGKVNKSSNIITLDRLGTSASKYFIDFRLKSELISCIRQKIWSDQEEIVSYIQSYILPPFSKAEPSIPQSIDRALAVRIKRNNKNSYRSLVIFSSWKKDVWSANLITEVDDYEQRNPSTGGWDDDIPF